MDEQKIIKAPEAEARVLIMAMVDVITAARTWRASKQKRQEAYSPTDAKLLKAIDEHECALVALADCAEALQKS